MFTTLDSIRIDLRGAEMSRWNDRAEATFEKCFVCQEPISDGPGRHDGKYIAAWGETVCKACCARNWDGIVTGSHSHLIPALEAKGIKVVLNANGFLDIPGNSPRS